LALEISPSNEKDTAEDYLKEVYMTRVGMNPARKGVTSYQPQEVTVAMLTYIPSLEGYFRHRLEVLKLSIVSLFSNTKIPFDFLVLDNGSCLEVVNYLRELNKIGKIDYLLLSSRNIGVEGGVRILSKAAMGNVFAFSNDDVFFYPNWLEKHMQILRTYPNVGMVSGSPVGLSSERADQSMREFIKKDIPDLDVSKKDRVESWEIDWAKSTGRDVREHLKVVEDMPHIVLNYHGVKAISSATHFQFVSPVEIIPRAFPSLWCHNLMDGMVQMDIEVDAMGLLRLSTPDRVTRHIGNVVDSGLKQEAERLGLDLDAPSERTSKKHWLLRIPGAGRVLRALYDWLFKVLHHLE